ncbi:MAG: adenosylcobinamide-GDP ribazoletransferase [Candidatus Electrothrix aestuarii]|uniref:Adenosylcobinamide-GDP ribazoletransferase n=1 Tax=Candidatus Electrothrix aestuarii TaxID=3062594 RepID=A0AAU8M223_9BACT|nr:adenosylcobinamide-GDP ribazoletransferase [Candidatus Electrothrix aestuarii]
MRLFTRRGSGNRRRKKTVRFQRKAPEQKRQVEPGTHQPHQPLNRAIITQIGSFVAALRFLSIIPFAGSFGTSEEELARSVSFFPLIGLLFSCIAVPLAWAMHLVLPPAVTAVLTVLLLLSFSGGLHLDGLADTADGFFSARPRERMLEIMRDSATGAMGVIALALLLSLKIACLASMKSQLLIAVFLMPLAGRMAILLLMAMLPYARPEGGLGSLFKGSFYSQQALIRAGAALLVLSGLSWAAAGTQGLLAVFAVLFMSACFAFLCRRKIGGVTGDTLGAACELAEAIVALVFTLNLGGLL